MKIGKYLSKLQLGFVHFKWWMKDRRGIVERVGARQQVKLERDWLAKCTRVSSCLIINII